MPFTGVMLFLLLTIIISNIIRRESWIQSHIYNEYIVIDNKTDSLDKTYHLDVNMTYNHVHLILD